jgi:hypothetical protein
MKEQGLSMQQVLKPTYEITPTMTLIKDCIWRPVQKSMTGKQSTTEITTKELQDIYLVIDKNFLEKWQIDLPFPSAENLHLLEQLIKEHNI